MLAFWGRERDRDGSFTEETETGAYIELERINALIDIRDMLEAFFISRAKEADSQ